MKLLAILSALLSIGVSVCYLEDANAECAVCWKTIYADLDDKTGVTKMAKCDEANIKTSWVKMPPTKMIELTDYDAIWKVSVPGLVVDANKVPHANIHSCIANRGACTPFVANSPGLSTHTPAIKTNLVAGSDGTFGAEFKTKVNLKNNQYTIIAHTRLLVLDGREKPTKYDIAIGISRTAVKADVSSSTSSVITAGVAGGCLLLILGAVVSATRSGKLHPEKIVVKVLNGPMIGFVSLVIGLGDVIAFTFTLVNLYQNPTVTTADVLPVAIMVLSIGWIISLTKAFKDCRKLYDTYVLGGQKRNQKYAVAAAAMVAKEQLQRGTEENAENAETAGAAPLLRQLTKSTLSRVTADANLMEAATELAKVNGKITTLYMVLVTLVLEQLPLIGISMYLLVNSEEVILADGLTLLFSSLVLGGNTIRTLSFPKFIVQKKELLKHFTETGTARESGSPRASKVSPAAAVIDIADGTDEPNHGSTRSN